MRTTKKSKIVAHLLGNICNLLVVLAVAVLLTACSDRETPAVDPDRVVAEAKTDRLAKAYQFGEVSTLSMMTKVEETNPKVSKSPKRATEDQYWLALAVYFEARSEPVAGQLKVASVVLNRVQDRRWPNTIEKVVRQGEARRHGCQFSFMCDGQPEKILNKRAWQKALEVAETALRAKQRGIDLGCAHSYRADYVTSKKALVWFAKFREETQINTHKFFCD